MCCHALFLRELSALHITPLGEDDWKFVPGLSADFNWYRLTVVNCNSEYHSFLSPVCPTGDSLKPRINLGTLNNTLLSVGRAVLVLIFAACDFNTSYNSWYLHANYLAMKLGLFCSAYKALLMPAPSKERTTVA